MHHDAIIILKLALNAHNWPARKLFFIFASLTEHLFWSACMDGRPACSAMILYYSTLFVSEKKKKKGNSLTSTQHMCIIQHYLKNKHFSALLWAGRNGLQPTPNTFHLGCVYHLDSSHRFLSTWGVANRKCLFKSIFCICLLVQA